MHDQKSNAMQMQLPLFPPSTRLINSCVGVFENDDLVYYLHNGSPIFCHHKGDVNNYRYITGNLIVTGLCTPIEISRTLGVSNRNIQRYAKALREKGSDWFFNRSDNRGSCHKLTDELLTQAQKMITAFYFQFIYELINIGIFKIYTDHFTDNALCK